MNNNIKKAPVNFWEDLLYFQHFMQIFVFCSKSAIITTLKWDFIAFKMNIVSISKRIVDVVDVSDVTSTCQSVITPVVMRFL